VTQLTGPDFIPLQVTELRRMAAFYKHRCGLSPAPASPPGAHVFATHPIPFAVREPLVDLGAVDQLRWGVALWMGCDDADATHDRLAASGLEIAAASSAGPFGRQFAFRDPDGYTITVHQQ
jgi:catechol 2,3-dioxygenase-like lactoylglutathione lyase family enzyme